MKIAAILAAVAAVAAAPLASAAVSGCVGPAGTAAVVDKLAITSTIKRTTVKGNARIVQTIKVTNNNANKVDNIKFGTYWTGESEFLKGNARAPGFGKVAIEEVAGLPTEALLSDPFSLPAGKTLKATIAFKAEQCPDTTPAGANVFDFGAAAVTVGAELLLGTCSTKADKTEVTINPGKFLLS